MGRFINHGCWAARWKVGKIGGRQWAGKLRSLIQIQKVQHVWNYANWRQLLNKSNSKGKWESEWKRKWADLSAEQMTTVPQWFHCCLDLKLFRIYRRYSRQFNLKGKVVSKKGNVLFHFTFFFIKKKLTRFGGKRKAKARKRRLWSSLSW